MINHGCFDALWPREGLLSLVPFHDINIRLVALRSSLTLSGYSA